MQTPEVMGTLDTWPLEFGIDGQALYPPQLQALVDGLGDCSDLLVLSHGWNNDTDEANELYRELLAKLGAQTQASAATEPVRRVSVLRVYWPSKRFAESDLIPGGAASLSGSPDAAAAAVIAAQIDNLLRDYPQADTTELSSSAFKARGLQRMKGLLQRLADDDAQRDFVRLGRSLLSGAAGDEDGLLDDSFLVAEGSDLLHKLGRPFRPRTLALGGAAAGMVETPDEVLRLQSDPFAYLGGAANLGVGFDLAFKGAQTLMNLITYFEMKERAGVVGSTGLADGLRQIRLRHPALRLHLCGHSFGGRLVTAALASMPAAVTSAHAVRSLCLLQAAFSHHGLSVRFDGERDGLFRRALEGQRLHGPVVVTHTKSDWAVGVAYPIASRFRGQVASRLGDANSRYGAIGSNGAQSMADGEIDGDETELRALGSAYRPFHPGRVYNLHGGPYINGHSAVRGPEVAQALWHAMTASP